MEPGFYWYTPQKVNVATNQYTDEFEEPTVARIFRDERGLCVMFCGYNQWRRLENCRGKWSERIKPQ